MAEWLRAGATIYVLQHHGWRKGVEQFCNRWSAHVQQGPGATTGEVEGVACLIAASPTMLRALATAQEAMAWASAHVGGGAKYDTAQQVVNCLERFDDAIDMVRVAIAKAEGRS